jgi:hypothetical protein
MIAREMSSLELSAATAASLHAARTTGIIAIAI